MSSTDNFVQICKNKLKERESLENILEFLRKEGCSKSQSIEVFLKMKYLPPEKIQFTQHMVHCSKTWADVRERDDELNEKFMDVLENEEF